MGSRSLLAGVIVCVAVLKLSVGLSLGAHPLLVPDGELDGAYYKHFAERVLAGDVWLLRPDSFVGQPPAPFFISPLYIYALAAFLKVGGSIAAVRASQLILGAVAVALISATARRWYGNRAMWLAGVLAAGCGLFTFYETLILQAALDPFLTALDLYTLTRAVQTGRRRVWATAGAAFGLHALNRPNMVIVAAGVAVLAIVRAVKLRTFKFELRSSMKAALFVSAAFIVIAPATVRNWRATGEFILISSHGGLNLLIGNGPDADGTFATALGVPPSIRGQWLDAPRIASAATGRTMTPSETSAFFRDRALEWMAAHPIAEARLLARKTWLTISGAFLTLTHSFPFFAHDTGSALRFLVVGPAVLVPLGIIGLVFAGPRRDGYWLWVAFVPLSALSVILFFVAARYRLPMQVALTVAAGGGLSWAFDRARARDWRRLGPALALGAVVLALVVWPTGLDDGRAEERARMGLYELERGSVAAGEAWIARAVDSHGLPGVVHLRAGQAHEAKGRMAEALGHYRAAQAIDSDEPSLHIAAARVLTGLGQPHDALADLDRVPPGVMNASVAREYERVGLAFATSGRPADAVTALGLAVSRDPKIASIRLNYAVTLAMVGRTDEARQEAQASLAIDPGYEKAREFLGRLRK